ncbi:hypothetical protein EW026_g1863 [Hermanssonia centrifuga]|nr:hypothetical protein EW026_g1863 [Hermanssonia centrifuga]
MELPGVKKNDVRILMNVCPYTHVRQLTVAGQSHSVLPTGPYTNQERRFGYFSRTVVVPVETKPGDIVANMEDGVLTLSVATGVPTAREEPQEITIQ